MTTPSKIGGFSRIILVSNNKAHLKNDTDMLALHNLKPSGVFESGPDALKHLARDGADLILLDTVLDDMTFVDFIQAKVKNPDSKESPVLVVSGDGQRETVLTAISAGVAGYVIRPYTSKTFERHLQTALQLARFKEIEFNQLEYGRELMEEGFNDDAIEEFEELVREQEEARQYYDQGCQMLVDGKFNKAIVAFQKAIRLNDLYAEAYEAMAEAYKAKGDSDHSLVFRKKAAQVYAEFDRQDEVRQLFIQILIEDPKAANPFNTLGVKLRRSGDYQGAIRAYHQAIELTPSDPNVYFNAAKAYSFMGDQESALEHLTSALKINPSFPEALKLYKELKGSDWPKGPAGKPQQLTSAVDRD